MNIDGIGTISANCKTCKHCTDKVIGVHWQYVKPDSTKEQLVAYYCSKKKKWFSGSSGDVDCYVPDRIKIANELKARRDKYQGKLNYVLEGHPLKFKSR